MTYDDLINEIKANTETSENETAIISAVDAYLSASNGAKPIVSGALPVDSAIKEIENLMERWHLARDNDDETLQGINDVLVNIGLLGWFNRQ